MNRWTWLVALGFMAACDVPQAPVITDPNGQQRIQVNPNGLTCYERRCLDIDLTKNTVRSIGSRTIGIPSGIAIINGTVTVEDFKKLSTAAVLAGGEGSELDNR